jgi:hypothetical protein
MTPRIDELRAQVHATPMPPAPARAWWQRRGVGLISGGALGLALAAGAAVLVLVVSDGSGAAPAYAAVLHTDGGQRTVTITLREEQNIPQLNARLEAEHTRIRVVPVVRGCHDPVNAVGNGEVIPGPARTELAIPQYMNGRPVSVTSETIAVDTIAGRTLVVPDSRTGLLSGGGGVVVGPAPSCVAIGPRVNLAKSNPARTG